MESGRTLLQTLHKELHAPGCPYVGFEMSKQKTLVSTAPHMQYHSAEDFLLVYKGPKQEAGGDEQSERPTCDIKF
jgi:hypothetical protein